MEAPKLGKVKLDEEYSLDLDYYLGSDYSDIALACEELPPVVEWVNSKMQELIERKYVMYSKIKEAEARAYFDLKGGRFEALYSGSMTADSLKHAVCLDKKVVELNEEYAVLLGWVARLQNLHISLQTKLDLIRSSEATRRRVFDANDFKEQ